jgi:hypothetical protein
MTVEHQELTVDDVILSLERELLEAKTELTRVLGSLVRVEKRINICETLLRAWKRRIGA